GEAAVKAWHFLAENKRLGYGDRRLVRVGHTFRCDPDRIALCDYGFHASVKALDAIYYARGPIACRVEMGGLIIRGDDKIVASERTVLAMVDATRILHEFACWCAERALRLVDDPDPRSLAAIEAKRKWLRGEIMDAELGAAGAAAWDAAMAAAWDAAWDAAMDAARYA